MAPLAPAHEPILPAHSIATGVHRDHTDNQHSRRSMKPHSCNMAFLPLALAFAFALARCMSSQEVPTACRASHASSPALTVCVSPSNSSCPAQPLFPLQSLFVTVSCHVSTRQPPRSSRPPALHASSSGCRAPASLPIHHHAITIPSRPSSNNHPNAAVSAIIR